MFNFLALLILAVYFLNSQYSFWFLNSKFIKDINVLLALYDF